jgi:hypothetical protein
VMAVYKVERRGIDYVVFSDAGGIESKHLLPAGARARADTLNTQVEAEDSKPPVDDSEALKRRQRKAVYRNPIYKAFKNLIVGRWKRNTERSYNDMMRGKVRPSDAATLKAFNDEQRLKEGNPQYTAFSLEKCMSITSSDLDVHAELNKTAGQHRVSSAANTRRQEGDPTRDEVKRRWDALALSGLPEGKRAAQIEEDTGLKNVRRIVRDLGLKTKKRA